MSKSAKNTIKKINNLLNEFIKNDGLEVKNMSDKNFLNIVKNELVRIENKRIKTSKRIFTLHKDK